ncbi:MULTISPECIES: MFS transporter [Shewanella]|uniref:MFS transporter n=1 Tax=Shewanella algae TaxID=38313 RepID=UPI001AAD7E6D|nr:MFS transporter [Shewanella algae]MBO2612395.1 MFS transporter [Shewanella algae]QTE89140.1 MFS transporter [Shewanella algae]
MAYRYRIALIFLLGFFIDCINIFMSAIALPDIAQELSISESSVAWVANSYILGLTLIIPVSNWLASKFGARKMMTVSMLVFSLGALCSGMTNEFYSLVFFRFLQGIGGGLLIPVGQALTFNLFKNKERTKISTLIMSIALIAPTISPSIGGIIVDHVSWRWVFLSNIPFSLLAAVLAACWIRSETKKALTPDMKGLLFVSTSLATLLIGLSIYANASSKLLPVLFIITGLGFSFLYLRHYRKTAHAIVDLSVLKNTHMRFSVLVYLAVPGVFTGVNLLNIFFLQEVLGWSAKRTGMLMVLYGVGSLIAITLGGRLYNRIGAHPLFLFGILAHSAGIAVLFFIGHHFNIQLLIIAYLLMGLGGGVSANTAQTTAMIDFDEATLTKASAVWNLNRQISFSLGCAFFTLLFNVLQHYTNDTSAYQLTFLLAAFIGITPLFIIKKLNRKPNEDKSSCYPKRN